MYGGTSSNLTPSDSTESGETLLSEQYEVFLNFCGKDTRTGFTDYLYTSLQGAGIRTFRDDNELRVGEEIGPELVKVIENSQISIPIVSKNYGSTRWCLIELAQIVKCHTESEGDKMILPIFYDVEPADVRNQRGSYESAFRQVEKEQHVQTVQSWKEALRMVGSLSGFNLRKETKGNEGELIKRVVELCMNILRKDYQPEPRNLVGMEDHIRNLEGMLRFGSNKVLIVGILGMGGLGKTTIAQVVYNRLHEQFEGHCFLKNIRLNSGSSHGIVNLQNRLISKLNRRGAKHLSDYHKGSKIKDATWGKKLLIVLDDVDKYLQVKMLVGNGAWLGSQSLIIIATRNKHVLDSVRRTCQTKEAMRCGYTSYQPNLMDDIHSLQLFSRYAFMKDNPLKEYNILCKEVVSIAAGLPLALVVFGSSFFGVMGKYLWEEKVRKLREIPNRKVLDKLRVSFEALKYKEKQIFLDIACFFVGSGVEGPTYMWDYCKFYPRMGIRNVINHSLITISDENTFEMHDQLRDLGRQIVYEESVKELGKRSRLWREEDARQMFETSQGTEDIEALCLDFVTEDLEFHPNRLVGDNFVNLPNLRFLVLGCVDLDGDFELLCTNIKWLKWAPPGSFSPINFCLKNLVILDLSYSKVTDDWEGWSQIKMAKHLKVLDLSHCYNMSTASHFSIFVTLRQLILSSCFGLADVNQCLGNLKNLRLLDLSNCLVLQGSLNCRMFSKLQSLDVSCTELCDLHGFEKLKYLKSLNTSGCRFIATLSNLSSLRMLSKLDTSGCVNLREIQGIENLECLEHLNLKGCLSMEKIPDISQLFLLKEVNIAKCAKLCDVDSLGNVEYLETLDMSFCTSLRSMPKFSKFKCLKKLRICGLKNQYIMRLGVLESLEILDVTGCKSMRILSLTGNLEQLKEVHACRCVELIEIVGLEKLSSLEVLDISGCVCIERLPDLSNLRKLRALKAYGCTELSEIGSINELKCLDLLDVRGCKLLGYISDSPKRRKANN